VEVIKELVSSQLVLGKKLDKNNLRVIKELILLIGLSNKNNLIQRTLRNLSNLMVKITNTNLNLRKAQKEKIRNKAVQLR
jgi:hypothetical protein